MCQGLKLSIDKNIVLRVDSVNMGKIGVEYVKSVNLL